MKTTANNNSAFGKLGLKKTVEHLCEEIRELYLADDVPWIIGYSGGKDSTAVTQLTWLALKELPEEKRKKVVHVISTDTLVENPIVASWVEHSLERMRKKANEEFVPFSPKLLTPKVEESFWVNLIGKGYPAPRHKFRWCTERLKIKPSNRFIESVVTENGEAILCIGARSAESAARAKVLKRNKRNRIRDRLSPSGTLPGVHIYTPVEEWTNDDVWIFLTQIKNPWGHTNKDLLNMYSGATADGECPLVVDTNTKSCGDSRFGCWVCTLVEKDKSMTAMIQNDAEKDWMAPLLDFRNQLDFRLNEKEEGKSDRHLRDFRRMSGAVQLLDKGDNVPGPYTQQARARWLRKLLEAQQWIRKNGPDEVRDIELIRKEELAEIRRIWVVEKHELEDLLPGIYKEITGKTFEDQTLEDNLFLKEEELETLAGLCGEDRLHYDLTRELLSVERQQWTQGRRAGLYDKLEKSIRRHYYEDEDEALAQARSRAKRKDLLKAERPDQQQQVDA